MSNEIAITNDFSVTRTAKSGRVTVRSALGTITSGNAAERAQLGGLLASKLIESANFPPIMREMARVFPPSSLKAHGVFKVLDTYGVIVGTTIYTIDGTWPMATTKAYCAAVAAAAEAAEVKGKPFKGEKAVYADWAWAVMTRIEFKEAEKAAAEALATEAPATKTPTTKAAAAETPATEAATEAPALRRAA
jgi:hypothetical protein